MVDISQLIGNNSIFNNVGGSGDVYLYPFTVGASPVGANAVVELDTSGNIIPFSAAGPAVIGVTQTAGNPGDTVVVRIQEIKRGQLIEDDNSSVNKGEYKLGGLYALSDDISLLPSLDRAPLLKQSRNVAGATGVFTAIFGDTGRGRIEGFEINAGNFTNNTELALQIRVFVDGTEFGVTENPYGVGTTSEYLVEVIKKVTPSVEGETNPFVPLNIHYNRNITVQVAVQAPATSLSLNTHVFFRKGDLY